MTLVQSKWLLVATIFVIVLAGCKNIPGDKNVLVFRPLLNKPYQFSLVKTTVTKWTYQSVPSERVDTIKAIFTIKNISGKDSSYICRLSFDQYVVNIPPVSVTFLNVDLSKPLVLGIDFSILDSIGYYAQGASLNVKRDKKGMVEKVDSIPQMLAVIAAKSHRDYASVKALLQDYISVNAITDLMNRSFSNPPVKEIVPGFRWMNTVTMITKAAIEVKTFYVPDQSIGDSLNINTSLLFASPDSSGVLKGNGKGTLLMSYSTGLPYTSQSNSETITIASEYDITEQEHLNLEQLFFKH
jgi:hypothetical protein